MGDFAEEFANAFSRAIPYVMTIVNALMPLVVALTGVITALNGMGGLGSLAVLGGGFLAMTGMGRGMTGAFAQGVRQNRFNDQYAISSTLGQRFNPRYNARQNARALAAQRQLSQIPGLPAQYQTPANMGGKPASGRWFGNKYMSGGAMGLAVPMLASLAMAMDPDNQVLQGIAGASPAAMLAMIPKWGGPMAGIAGGAMLVRSGMQTRGGAGAALQTGLGGAGLAGGALALAGVTGGTAIPFIAAAAAIAGLVGYFQGGKNQDKFEAAGGTAAWNRLQQNRASVFGATSIQSIRDELKAYDDFLADPSAMQVEAKQRGVSYDHFVTGLQEGRGGFATDVKDRIELWNTSIDTIMQVTDETFAEVETNAHRLGLNLGNAADAAQYFWRMNERWKSSFRADGSVAGITRDYFASTLTGVLSNRVENSVFTTGTESQRLMEAKIQSAAANTAFMNRIASGNFDWSLGSDDSALAQTVLDTTLALGTQLRGPNGELLEGSALAAWGQQGLGALQAMAVERGYVLDPGSMSFFNHGAGRTFNLKSESAIEEFKETPIGKAMTEIMEGGLKMTDPDEVNARLAEAMQSGDPEGALERLNVVLWSDEAQAAAEKLHTLGVNAQTAAERLALLSTDPNKLPSYDNSTSGYALDPGQRESRKPAETAPVDVPGPQVRFRRTP